MNGGGQCSACGVRVPVEDARICATCIRVARAFARASGRVADAVRLERRARLLVKVSDGDLAAAREEISRLASLDGPKVRALLRKIDALEAPHES